MPDVGHGQSDVVGKSSRPVHTDTHGMRAQMAAAGEAVPAAPADHVPFAGYYVTPVKIVHIRAGLDNFANKLMTDDHRDRDGALGPFIPVVDVQISSANSDAPDADENIVDPDGGFGNLFQPQPR